MILYAACVYIYDVRTGVCLPEFNESVCRTQYSVSLIITQKLVEY